MAISSIPIDGVELKHLRSALLAAELHSFSKAAAFERIKQVTLGRRISYLESRFGSPLFRRSPRGVVPTEAGEVFLDAARRVLDEVEGLYKKTRAVCQGEAGSVAIGFITSVLAGNLRSSLHAFQSQREGIHVKGVEDVRYRLQAKLEAGSLDILILSGAAEQANTNVLGLWSEPMFVALPQGHPLALRERVYWSDLHGVSFIAARTTADDITAMVMTKLAQAGEEPSIVVTDTSREAVLGSVGAGRGMTLVTAGSLGMTVDNVIFRPLYDATGPHLVSFSAYWRDDNHNPALRTFLAFLRDRYSLAPIRP